ncbi:unnamed protein product [Caenorhabditis angaria]|uniref:B9 domain-containing protein 1 n=1 Tax=Caenorhabditis angaria TaxID=860376 RepID=A0A9P1IWQ0_9PELO|nr:unnamed protein product [Caenorhabditis angaria]
MEKKSSIVVTVHGNVTSAQFPEEENICIKLNVATSEDWRIISGDHSVLSSFSFRGATSHMNIDLPFETSYKSSTPYMWPRYVFSCYSKNRSGNDCLKAYGSLFVPTTPGRHLKRVYCFLPEPSSMIQRITARIRELNAELVNPLMPGFSDGRHALRVTSKGYLDIEINISIKCTDTSLQFTSMSHNTTPSSTSNLNNSDGSDDQVLENIIK